MAYLCPHQIASYVKVVSAQPTAQFAWFPRPLPDGGEDFLFENASFHGLLLGMAGKPNRFHTIFAARICMRFI